MTIQPNKVVVVHYTLTENDAAGEMIESTKGRDPLAFIYGIGMMIPHFEQALSGMQQGDTFAFGIEAANAYGLYEDDKLVEVPKNMFEVDGKIQDGLLEVGNVLPLTNNEGEHFEAMVAWVGLDKVKLDFNHPMAGVNLFFTGHIEQVRDAEPIELEHGHVHGPGGHHH